MTSPTICFFQLVDGKADNCSYKNCGSANAVDGVITHHFSPKEKYCGESNVSALMGLSKLCSFLVPKLHLGTQVSPQLCCFSLGEAQLRRQARSQVQLGNEEAGSVPLAGYSASVFILRL
jgi:hypothetical protein